MLLVTSNFFLGQIQSLLIGKCCRGHAFGSSRSSASSTHGHDVEAYVSAPPHKIWAFTDRPLVVMVSYAGYHAADIPKGAIKMVDLAYVSQILLQNHPGL
jgi:hypothetical protein